MRVAYADQTGHDVKARAGARGLTIPCPQAIPHRDFMGFTDAVGVDVNPRESVKGRESGLLHAVD